MAYGSGASLRAHGQRCLFTRATYSKDLSALLIPFAEFPAPKALRKVT